MLGTGIFMSETQEAMSKYGNLESIATLSE